MIKGRITLDTNNINTNGIMQVELEDTFEESNNSVVIFPMIRTRKNKDNYDATLFHVATKIGCRPWGSDDLSLQYRLYTQNKRLELALSYANNSNDWNECLEIDIHTLESEELDFIRSWLTESIDI